MDDEAVQSCTGRVALVTGASRGIGAAIAGRLAADGAKVAVSARTLDDDGRGEGSLMGTVERIRSAGGVAVPVRADLAVHADRVDLIAQTVAQLGPIDILVNNAAITYYMPFTEFTEKRYQLMFEVQVRAPFDLAQMVVPSMLERGEGWVLNISSRAGQHPVGPPFAKVYKEGFTVYGMVKAALDRFTTGLAAELDGTGIAVNSLSPWDNVLTPGAAAHDLIDDFPTEDISCIADAALALCTCGAGRFNGRVAFSQPLLHELNTTTPERKP